MSWFTPEVVVKTEYVPLEVRVVEVEKGETLPVYSDDLKRSVGTLQAHPGFLYLLQKLNAQRAYLRTTLETKRHPDLKEAEFLQSGIAWSGWLEAELKKAVSLPAPAAMQASPTEQSIFEESQRMLEVLR